MPPRTTVEAFDLCRYNWLATALSRRDCRDDLAAIAPIDPEVAIESEDDTLLIEFGHSDQASIGQRHRHVGELLHQRAERVDLRHDVKVGSDDSSRDEFQDSTRPAVRVLQQKARLREHRIAGEERRLEGVHDFACPSVVVLAAVEQCDERACIDDDGGHLPYPDMCFRLLARSVGPSTEPTKLPASEVTERLFPFASISSASRTSADRLEPRDRASSFRASSRSSESLKDTVRIGVAMVILLGQQGITEASDDQSRSAHTRS
jgi:hypothetical protein